MPFSRSAFAFGLYALLTLTAPVLSADKPLPPVGKLPPHTAFLTQCRFGTVYATGSYESDVPGRLYLQRPGHRLVSVASFVPASIAFSPDGTRMIGRRFSTFTVWRTSDLHRLAELPDSAYAWWDGNRLSYLRGDQDYFLLKGRRISNSVRGTDLITADSRGRYFIGLKQIGPGTPANGSTPLQRMTLWHLSASGRFHLVRTLLKPNIDTVEGYPYHLSVLNSSTLVFALPGSGGVGTDYLCALRNGHLLDDIKDRQGHNLLFGPQQPLVTPNSVVGIAYPAPNVAGHTSAARYFYRLTNAGLSIRRVAANVTFVTYDPQRGIGLGVSTRTGTSIVYGTSGKLL